MYGRSFDKIDGVITTVSGYSGETKNPTIVIYKDTGHVETIEIIYNLKK